jgi:hypothetical protein
LKPIENIYLKDVKNVSKSIEYYKKQVENSKNQYDYIINLYVVYGLHGLYKVVGGRTNIIDKFCSDREFVEKLSSINNSSRDVQIHEAYGHILSAYLWILGNKVAMSDVQQNPANKNKTSNEIAVLEIKALNKKLKRIFSDRADSIEAQSLPFIKCLTFDNEANRQIRNSYQSTYGTIYTAYTETISEFIVGSSNYKCKNNPYFEQVLEALTMKII